MLRSFLLVLLTLLSISVKAELPSGPPETLRPRQIAAKELLAILKGRLEADRSPAAITFQNTTIGGDLDLSDWNVPFILRFESCSFEGNLAFRHFRTERSLLFDRCTFAGRTDFTEMHLGIDFAATRCRFAAKGSDDPTTFLQGEIGDDFSLNGSTIEGTINLRHLDVGRDLYLQDCAFNGRVPDPDDEGPTIVDVKLAGSKIGHFLRIDHDLDADPRLRFSINDCLFAGIFAQSKDHNTEEGEKTRMLRMLDDLTYRAEMYDLVEREFKRRGRDALSDDVYIHGQDRELSEAQGFDRLRLTILKVVAGYGRRPALALAWCLLAVVTGAFIFAAGEEERRGSRAFWYSLDLFVPFVSVTGKEPEAPEAGFARHYVRIHRLLGWLLLPIALATVSGVVHP